MHMVIRIPLEPTAHASKRKFLLALTIWTWITAALLSVLFFLGVHSLMEGLDWLAGLLLGMIVFGWVVTLSYIRALNQPIQGVKGDRYGMKRTFKTKPATLIMLMERK
jgi:cobalamin synthase